MDSASILLLPSQKTKIRSTQIPLPTPTPTSIPNQSISTTPATTSNTKPTPEVAPEFLPAIQGTIKPGEVKKHTVLIDKSNHKVSFSLFLEEGDLGLALYTPSGAKINSSSASNNPKIKYASEKNFKSYEVTSPESGNWTLEVTAINVKAAGEDYSGLITTETDLFVAAATDKNSYTPNEPMIVAAYVQNNGTPVPKVNITATITKPDNTKSSLQLYDDGLHKDDKANDGIYAGVFSNTNINGSYDILVTASGTVNGQTFERKGAKTAWVESYPELSITSSDINFSNNTPASGENITINATIHNTGIGNADNAAIFFYDGEPANNGVLIAENKINISAGKTAIASSSWKATAGQHNIYVYVSPFNDFLEKNTSNNKAFKSIQAR